MEKFALPGSSWPNTDIVGEFYHQQGIVAALQTKPTRDDYVTEDVEAELVPEPSNPHDPNAIGVRVRGYLVGHLDRDTVRDFAPHVHRVAASGLRVTTAGQIFAQYRDGYDSSNKAKLYAEARISLPDPDLILPLNVNRMDGVAVLPRGGTLQVTGEEEHFEHLFDYLPQSGRAAVILTLHPIERRLKNGDTRHIAEVRLDGERVGQLTPGSSAHFLPTIERIDADGYTLGVWATLTGNELSAELKIHGTKAAEVPGEWLREPTPAPSLIAPAESYDVPEPEPAAGRGDATLKPGRKAPSVKSTPGTPPPADQHARQVFVSKKPVTVTEKDRQHSPGTHRGGAIGMCVIMVLVAGLLGMVPAIGPILAIGALVGGFFIARQMFRVAKALEIERATGNAG